MELYLAVYFFMVTYLFFGGWGERVEVFSVFDQIQEIFCVHEIPWKTLFKKIDPA